MTLLQRAPDFLRGVTTPRLITLLYHRINDLGSDPQLLAVKPRHFEEHLSVLKDSYSTVKFECLTEEARGGGSRKSTVNTVVVTFDDGYADNFTEALPLLERYAIPATVFVTTDIVQHQRHFWWDELEHIILGEHSLPQVLEVELDGNFSWSLNGDSNWSAERRQSYSNWSLLEEHDPTVRHLLYRQVGAYLRVASEDERIRVLRSLSDWAQMTAQGELNCQALSASDLIELDNSGLVEVGSHTVHHPVLSKLSAAAQKQEMVDSRRFLEDVLGKEIRTFAYPYGTRSDYTAETVALVEDTGYSAACVNIPEATWPGTDRFQAPRLLVRDCDGDVFGQWLAQWFGKN